MATLKKEYTDTKKIRHKVAHSIAPGATDSKERIVEDLFNALTKPIKPNKRVPA